MKFFIIIGLLIGLNSQASYIVKDFHITLEATSDVEVLSKFQTKVSDMIRGTDEAFNSFLSTARCEIYGPRLASQIQDAQREIELQSFYKVTNGSYTKMVRGRTVFSVGPCYYR